MSGKEKIEEWRNSIRRKRRRRRTEEGEEERKIGKKCNGNGGGWVKDGYELTKWKGKGRKKGKEKKNAK